MPVGERAINVRGLGDLQRAFARTNKDLSKVLRQSLQDIAEPIRVDAEARAAREIRNIGSRWFRMRSVVRRELVYVAPKERGRRTRVNSRRPNLAGLLLERAMEPALEAHAKEIEERFGDLLDDVFDRWSR